jgi:hypothetical protein
MMYRSVGSSPPASSSESGRPHPERIAPLRDKVSPAAPAPHAAPAAPAPDKAKGTPVKRYALATFHFLP